MRLKRKNRGDINFKNQGGLLDAFDDAIKSVWRINDDEYDFIIAKATDEELLLFVKEELTFAEKRKALTVISNLLKQKENEIKN